jgi:hypothetical protein
MFSAPPEAAEGSIGGSGKTDSVTIPKTEYEAMRKEITFQESLITGFQKENDKLAAQVL